MSVPSRSIRAPPGSGLPPLSATSTLPSATTDVAQSSTSGAPSGIGTPMLTGLVDMRRSVPPKGATIMPSPLVLTKWIEMKPLAAASSAQSPMRPRWPELRRPTTETPYSRALSPPRA